MKKMFLLALSALFACALPKLYAQSAKGLTGKQIDSLAYRLTKSATYVAYTNDLEAIQKAVFSHTANIDNAKYSTFDFTRVLHSITLNPIQKSDSLARMGLAFRMESLQIESKELMQEFPELSGLRAGTVGAVFFTADKLRNPNKYKETYRSDPNNLIFTKAQRDAEFPGGAEAFKRYLDRNLKKDAAALEGASPGVYNVKVQFIIDYAGNVSNVKAIEFPHGCKSCAQEAVKVIRQGPKWQPAFQNGHNVTFQKIEIISFPVGDL